jgi:hypothetical protein
MIRTILTKKDILKKLNKIADLKQKQAFYLRDLAHSLEYHHRNDDYATWKKIIFDDPNFIKILKDSE